MNFLSFCLSRDVLIFTTPLKDSVAGYRIFSPLLLQKYHPTVSGLHDFLFYFILFFFLWDQLICYRGSLVSVMSRFSFTAFTSFYFSLSYDNLIVIYFIVGLWIFPTCHSLSFLNLCVYFLQIWKIFGHDFFKQSLCPLLSPPSESLIMHVLDSLKVSSKSFIFCSPCFIFLKILACICHLSWFLN